MRRKQSAAALVCQSEPATTLLCFSQGCGMQLFPLSERQAEAKLCGERMLPAPADWLMLCHLLLEGEAR